HGSWKITHGSETITVTFNSNGVLEQKQGDYSVSGIWKADDSNLYMYNSSFGSVGSSSMPYTISGSTCTISGSGYETVLTRE
ncbi:MAG: hypothetical protein LBG24_11085, partial [Treponema sp.]|nr:hypothetical protein [Treponema sp.]